MHEAQSPNITLEERLLREAIDLIQREEGLYSGRVPLSLINDKDVPVNEENLELIGLQLENEAELKGNDGQIQPIVLGLVEGFDQLEIIDGFHRFRKFQVTQKTDIYSTVIKVTHEELLDKRIQNTRNHQGLQFARATDWVREVWSLSPYSDRITASQAFTLGRIKTFTGVKLGLSKEEVDEIMEWVDKKAELWGVEPVTIYSYLRTSEAVTKDLVRNSRPEKSQSADNSALPQSTLQAIGRKLPGREELQLELAKVITENKLGSAGISSLMADIVQMDDDSAIDHIRNVDFAAYKERIAAKPVYKYPEDTILRMDRVRESSRVKPLDEMASLTCKQVELVLEEGSYDGDRMKAVKEDLRKVVDRLVAQVAEIDLKLTGQEAIKHDEEADSTPKRAIEEFSKELKNFLTNPSSDLTITTRREAMAAERAVERGRGTREALEKLQESIDKYNNQ